MAKSKPTGRFLHYDPERTDFAVSGAELEKLRKGEHPVWKDVCLVTLALALPFLANAGVEFANQPVFQPTKALFINSLFGMVSLIIAAIAGTVWYQKKKEFTSVIEEIRKKPRFELPAGILDAGAVHPKPPEQPAQ